jgi:nucleoside-diphosphate-sugar epimerase
MGPGGVAGVIEPTSQGALDMNILVTGAGGFIGGHLVARLVSEGHDVSGVDIKDLKLWHQVPEGSVPLVSNVADLETCRSITQGMDEVYNLACDMGGMGFIENNKALCMLSVLPSTHMLMASREAGVGRFFFSSSACVYAAEHQTSAAVNPLKEQDAYPAQPEDGYGWEKLFTERMCRHFHEDFGLETRCARYHNVYGPLGTWEGGREKAPAAVCRKVAYAVLSGVHEIEIWGDGEQTRSFTYIDDCIEGTLMVTRGHWSEPINIGSSEIVTINQLVTTVEDIAGITLKRSYKLDAPQGVRGRNSDNMLIQREYGWEPSTPLVEGLTETYHWIFDQLKSAE